MRKNAVLCHHSRPDRKVVVEVTAEGATTVEGDLIGSKYNKTDWHNNNAAYWIRFV